MVDAAHVRRREHVLDATEGLRRAHRLVRDAQADAIEEMREIETTWRWRWLKPRRMRQRARDLAVRSAAFLEIAARIDEEIAKAYEEDSDVPF